MIIIRSMKLITTFCIFAFGALAQDAQYVSWMTKNLEEPVESIEGRIISENDPRKALLSQYSSKDWDWSGVDPTLESKISAQSPSTYGKEQARENYLSPIHNTIREYSHWFPITRRKQVNGPIINKYTNLPFDDEIQNYQHSSSAGQRVVPREFAFAEKAPSTPERGLEEMDEEFEVPWLHFLKNTNIERSSSNVPAYNRMGNHQNRIVETYLEPEKYISRKLARPNGGWIPLSFGNKSNHKETKSIRPGSKESQHTVGHHWFSSTGENSFEGADLEPKKYTFQKLARPNGGWIPSSFGDKIHYKDTESIRPKQQEPQRTIGHNLFTSADGLRNVYRGTGSIQPESKGPRRTSGDDLIRSTGENKTAQKSSVSFKFRPNAPQSMIRPGKNTKILNKLKPNYTESKSSTFNIQTHQDGTTKLSHLPVRVQFQKEQLENLLKSNNQLTEEQKLFLSLLGQDNGRIVGLIREIPMNKDFDRIGSKSQWIENQDKTQKKTRDDPKFHVQNKTWIFSPAVGMPSKPTKEKRFRYQLSRPKQVSDKPNIIQVPKKSTAYSATQKTTDYQSNVSHLNRPIVVKKDMLMTTPVNSVVGKTDKLRPQIVQNWKMPTQNRVSVKPQHFGGEQPSNHKKSTYWTTSTEMIPKTVENGGFDSQLMTSWPRQQNFGPSNPQSAQVNEFGGKLSSAITQDSSPYPLLAGKTQDSFPYPRVGQFDWASEPEHSFGHITLPIRYLPHPIYQGSKDHFYPHSDFHHPISDTYFETHEPFIDFRPPVVPNNEFRPRSNPKNSGQESQKTKISNVMEYPQQVLPKSVNTPPSLNSPKTTIDKTLSKKNGGPYPYTPNPIRSTLDVKKDAPSTKLTGPGHNGHVVDNPKNKLKVSTKIEMGKNGEKNNGSESKLARPGTGEDLIPLRSKEIIGGQVKGILNAINDEKFPEILIRQVILPTLTSMPIMNLMKKSGEFPNLMTCLEKQLKRIVKELYDKKKPTILKFLNDMLNITKGHINPQTIENKLRARVIDFTTDNHEGVEILAAMFKEFLIEMKRADRNPKKAVAEVLRGNNLAQILRAIERIKSEIQRLFTPKLPDNLLPIIQSWLEAFQIPVNEAIKLVKSLKGKSITQIDAVFDKIKEKLSNDSDLAKEILKKPVQKIPKH